jgi:5-methylcytosine-specific restriction protein A
MAISDVSAPDVAATLDEFDRLGREEFLARYGYGPATTYFLVRDGVRYDSKAVLGVAHQVSNGRPLGRHEFSGGEKAVATRLRDLGYTVEGGQNPDWDWDEIVLACALVASNGWRYLNASDPRVHELSALLQRLPLHPPEVRQEDFRNANGVARKTADIATQHPNYTGKATRGNQLDRRVLERFLADPDGMAAEARSIAAEATASASAPVSDPPDLDLDLPEDADEGRVRERRHLARERDPRLRKRKIEAVRASSGEITCEACGFDFAAAYGERGRDFIECHHRIPLHVSGPTRTRLADLVLLCSNCHRMVHRGKPWLTFEELREMVARIRD